MLNSKLSDLPAISHREARLLQKLNLTKISHLLHYYPRQHLHFQRTRICHLQEGENVTLVGKVVSHEIFTTRQPGLTLQKWRIRDRTGKITCTQFYRHSYYQSHSWRTSQHQLYRSGVLVVVFGKVKADSYQPHHFVINNPQIQVVDLTTAKFATSTLISVYPLTQGVSQDLVRSTIAIALNVIDSIADPLPKKLRQRLNLMDLESAIPQGSRQRRVRVHSFSRNARSTYLRPSAISL